MTEPQFARPQLHNPGGEAPHALAAPTSANQPAPAVAPSGPAAVGAVSPSAATGAPPDPHVLSGRREGVEHAGDTVAQGRATESSIAKRRAKARAAERDAQRAERAAGPRAQPAHDSATTVDNTDRAPLDPPVASGPWTFSAMHLGQVLTWQAALVAIVAAHRQPTAILVPVLILGVVMIALTAVRARGRWLYEWAGIWLRYHGRNREMRATDNSTTTLLRSTDRRVTVGRLDVDGIPAAVIKSPTGYSLVIDPVLDERRLLSRELPRLPALSDLLPNNDPAEPAVTIQQLTLMLPAPNALNRNDAAARSYATLGGSSVPARSRTWVIAQATVTPDTRGWPELEATLLNAARRLQRRLTKAGFAPRLVTEPRLTEDLTALLRGDAAAHVAPTVDERWTSWGMDGAMSTTYGLERWSTPSVEGFTRLLHELHHLPTMATTVALAGRRDGEYVDVQAVVRITDRDHASLDETDREVQRIAAAAGIGLLRMNGEHVHGVRATLPLGGFAT